MGGGKKKVLVKRKIEVYKFEKDSDSDCIQSSDSAGLRKHGKREHASGAQGHRHTASPTVRKVTS